MQRFYQVHKYAEVFPLAPVEVASRLVFSDEADRAENGNTDY
ncbi:hypothetical protein FEDK69T_02810 [Flavobacterium enshiense DK69]|nr:hypothetical protein FEDK69T_02810 [Flavobacterium enshiense DK69]